jgi:hypothetical protein
MRLCYVPARPHALRNELMRITPVCPLAPGARRRHPCPSAAPRRRCLFWLPPPHVTARARLHLTCMRCALRPPPHSLTHVPTTGNAPAPFGPCHGPSPKFRTRGRSAQGISAAAQARPPERPLGPHRLAPSKPTGPCPSGGARAQHLSAAPHARAAAAAASHTCFARPRAPRPAGGPTPHTACMAVHAGPPPARPPPSSRNRRRSHCPRRPTSAPTNKGGDLRAALAPGLRSYTPPRCPPLGSRAERPARPGAMPHVCTPYQRTLLRSPCSPHPLLMMYWAARAAHTLALACTVAQSAVGRGAPLPALWPM